MSKYSNLKLKPVLVSALKKPEYYKKEVISGYENFLSKSFDYMGVQTPICVNSNPERKNIVFDGVSRLEAYQTADVKLIKVLYCDLPLEEEKRYHALLNKQSAQSSKEQLLELLGEIHDDFFSDSIPYDKTAKVPQKEKATHSKMIAPWQTTHKSDREHRDMVVYLQEHYKLTSQNKAIDRALEIAYDVAKNSEKGGNDENV